MKVLLLSTNGDDAGAPRHVEFIFSELKNKIDYIVVFGSKGGVYDRLYSKNPKNVFLLKGLKSSINPFVDFLVLYRLIKIIISQKPQLIHCHSSKAAFLSRLASWLSGVPVVYTIHGWPWRGFSFLKKHILVLIEKLLSFHNGTHYIGVANCVFLEAADVGITLKKERCLTLYNTVRIEREKASDIPNEFEFEFLVMPARVSNAKDHYTVAAAFDVSDYPGKLIFAGRGTEANEFKSKISNCMKIRFPDIIFLGERSDIHNIISKSDGVLLCSHFETFPLTILEAFAFSKPMVASDVGGNKEIIRHGHNGLLANTKEDWANSISLLGIEKYRKNLSLNALNSYEKNFKISSYKKKLESIYINAIK